MEPMESDSKSVDNDMRKTPISLLQELCGRRGLIPRYDLIQIEGAVHEPSFLFRLTFGGYEVTGAGLNKKKAKQLAAQNALELLCDSTQKCQIRSLSADELAGLQKCLRCDEDTVSGNPISELHALCLTRRWNPPVYEFVRELSERKEILFKCTCSIGSEHEEQASAGSKKLAKRLVSHRLLDTLKVLYNDKSDFVNDTLLSEEGTTNNLSKLTSASFLNCDQNSVSNDFKNLNLPFSKNRQESIKLFQGFREASGYRLQELLDKSVDQLECHETFLEQLGVEQNFNITYIDIEERAKDDNYQCFIEATLSPLIVLFGSGGTRSDARSNAAYNMLVYLKNIR